MPSARHVVSQETSHPGQLFLIMQETQFCDNAVAAWGAKITVDGSWQYGNFSLNQRLKDTIRFTMRSGRCTQAASGAGAGFSTAVSAFSSRSTIERLVQERVHACGQAPFAVFREGVCGQRDYRRSPTWLLSFGSTDPSGSLDAVSTRHVGIDEHEVIGSAGSAQRAKIRPHRCRSSQCWNGSLVC
jgi:hypothetical protein